MIKLLLLLGLYSFSYGVVTVGLDGTQDFSTIQSAIDFVTQNPNDLVIEVSPGVYQENLLIESDMIIRSSGDANNTIIDGSLGRGLGSTVAIRPKSGSVHKPQVEIDGFGISNGQGTDMIDKTITFPNGQHPIEKNGGGMLIYVNNPKVNNCKFTNNGISSTGKGGAVYAISSGEDSDFSTRDDYEDANGLTPANGPLDLSNNVFSSNDAAIGLSVFITGFDTINDLSSCGFDVYNAELEGSSELWVKGLNSDFDQSDGSGNNTALVGDVYVSPNGSDEGNSGLSWESPFKTITHALSMIFASADYPATIYLASGEYSPETNGEAFPLNLISHVRIIGQSATTTSIDAMASNRVFLGLDVENVELSHVTVTGGVTDGDEDVYSVGAGLFLSKSDVLMENMVIDGNISRGNVASGGGIYCNYSNPTLQTVDLINNSVESNGESGWYGGVECIAIIPAPCLLMST